MRKCDIKIYDMIYKKFQSHVQNNIISPTPRQHVFKQQFLKEQCLKQNVLSKYDVKKVQTRVQKSMQK